MYSVIRSFGLNGLNGFAVAVEADVSGGMPALSIVGLPDSAVRESGDRVHAAARNLGFKWPDRRITVNLAPADVRKTGPVYDLPLLLAVLSSAGQIEPPPEEAASVRPRSVSYAASLEQDKELQAIFERTYGKVEQRAFQPQKKPARTSLDGEKYSIRTQKQGPEYLLVDGYNVIFAWEELERLARQDVAAARGALEDILSNYQGFRRCVVILVFDAYKVKGNPGSVERRNGIYVVYTKEAETADAYIEKATYEIGKKHRVRVATSDGAEQLIILGHGALRLSASTFRAELERTGGEIQAILERNNRRVRSQPVKAALDRAGEARRREREEGS